MQPSAKYRRKAVKLRAAAARFLNNITDQYEFPEVAEGYDLSVGAAPFHQ